MIKYGFTYLEGDIEDEKDRSSLLQRGASADISQKDNGDAFPQTYYQEI